MYGVLMNLVPELLVPVFEEVPRVCYSFTSHPRDVSVQGFLLLWGKCVDAFALPFVELEQTRVGFVLDNRNEALWGDLQVVDAPHLIRGCVGDGQINSCEQTLLRHKWTKFVT